TRTLPRRRSLTSQNATFCLAAALFDPGTEAGPTDLEEEQMRLKKVGAFALAAILFGVAPLGAVAHAETKLRALSAWATSLPSVPDVFYKFQEAATKASNGEITFQNTGPETVPPFEQLEPL